MNTVSIILLVIAACASVVGTAMMLKNLRTSPEGFEDIEGFHAGRTQEAVIRQPVHAQVLEHRTAA